MERRAIFRTIKKKRRALTFEFDVNHLFISVNFFNKKNKKNNFKLIHGRDGR